MDTFNGRHLGNLDCRSQRSRSMARFRSSFSLCLLVLFLLLPSTGLLGVDLVQSILAEATKLKLSKKEISFSFRLPDGTLLEHRAEEARAPASCMKLIVAAACLDLLGPDYLLQTNLMRLGTVEDGVLDGDLLVVGGGDPAICGRENDKDPLWELRPWIDRIRSQGIDVIRGRILADVRQLEGSGVHPDWPKDQLSRWYCAPSGALNLNDNCVDVVIGPVVSGAVEVSVRPAQPRIKLRNSLTVCEKKKDHLYRVDRRGDGWDILVSGKFLKTGGVRTEYVAVPDPAEAFVSVFLQLLHDSGITVRGESISPAAKADIVATISHSLSSRIPVMLKRSQNLYADALARVLGRARGGNGSFESAAQALEKWIHQRIGQSNSVVIRDGSGLSRNNQLTARILRKVVELVLVQEWGGVLLDGLPLAGMDGTLESRLTRTALVGKVRAKTGTIRGVSSLAGVLDTEQGPVSFCFLYQGRSGRASLSRDWQDRSLLKVAKTLNMAKIDQN
ncbi:MAG: D-alanyl-D-alanine carboxypeptidase/D-alanyl-D-alanine-endopeptidase [Planctomycetota bacterium]